MAKRTEALVTPALLAWARKTAGLTLEEAARRINRSEEDVAAWEIGDKLPSLAQARKAAEVYRRPLAVFYLPEPPRKYSVPKLTDFRHLPVDVPIEFSYQLRMLIRRVQVQQEWARETLVDAGEPKLDFVGSRSVSSDPVELASEIRNKIDFRREMRDRWGGRDESLRNWIQLAESIGVFVFQVGGIDPIEARGFALTDLYAPFIYLNSKDARTARTFTLAHELVHLWIGAPGISNLSLPPKPKTDLQKIEIFCNKVAAEIIVPLHELRLQWEKLDGTLSLRNRIDRMSYDFRVSTEVIARRLLDLDIIKTSVYEKLRKEFQNEWHEQRQKMSESNGGPPYARRVIQENGRTFVDLVVSAYKSGAASGRDLSNLLNLKLNNLSRVTAELTASSPSRKRPA